jgi:hypothetical protein
MTADTLLSGSLKDFGLAEVLQVMDLGGKTGAIHLKQDKGQAAILYFNQGKLASCSEFDPDALTLGDVLQQLGIATRQQIDRAFSQQLQDVFGKRIGERLMMMRVINERQLHEGLRTKAIWTARELARWKEGTYEFIASPNIEKLLPYGEGSLEIEVMRVIMEMVRYSDTWQELSAFLPYGTRTMLQMAPVIPRTMHFPARTLQLFRCVNLHRKVRRIATAMQCPELEMAHELAQLIQQNFLRPVLTETVPHSNDRAHARRVYLPTPAEKLRLEHFQFFDLVVRMEQAWERKRNPADWLTALAEFVNWTMDTLAEACRANKTELDPNTLRSLLGEKRLWHIRGYEFQVDQNHIDVDHFAVLCKNVLKGEVDDIKTSGEFYDEASLVLGRILATIFELINARIADPLERLENQEVWEAMFEQFALKDVSTQGS